MFFDLPIIVSLILAITIHECSHALVANALGDPTAKMAGRISLNPLRHLDFLGTVLLFLINIGWGKPVPVNPHNFRYPIRDNALTAFAGPFANLLMVFVLVLPLKYLVIYMPGWLGHLLATFADVNIILFIFNILPFPPLDGSKIVGILIPARFQLAYHRYLQQGMLYFVLFLLFDQFVLSHYLPFSIFQYLIGNIAAFLKAFIFFGT